MQIYFFTILPLKATGTYYSIVRYIYLLESPQTLLQHTSLKHLGKDFFGTKAFLVYAQVFQSSFKTYLLSKFSRNTNENEDNPLHFSAIFPGFTRPRR